MGFGNDLTINIKARDEASNTLNKIRGNLKDHSAAFERAGKQMLIASAALTAGLGLAIKQAASFQQSMAQVSTMLDQQSMKYMPAFSKAIKSMSMKFGEGTKTLADGLYNILSASIPAAQAVDVLEESVKAAKAGLTDTGIAADAITTIINAYGMSADKAADVSDLLFAIVKRGKLTFAELAPNIGKVAAMAAKTGLSLEGLGATIATLTRSGVRTEMAMTAVRGILNGMLKPAKEAAEAFENRLGVAMNTTTLKAEGVVGILTRMKEAGLKPEEISKMFPNVRALVGVVAAMGDLEGVTYDYDLMVNRAGLSQEAFDKNINTTQVSMLKFKETLNVVLVSLGTQLLPIVDRVTGALSKVGEAFVKLSPNMQKMIGYTIALTAALLALSGVMLIVLAKIPMMVAGWHIVAAVLAKVAAVAAVTTAAMTLGLGAAITFTALKITKLVTQTREYIQALKDQASASMLVSDLQTKAFAKTIQKFGEIKDKFKEINPEYANQVELIERLRDNYDQLGQQQNITDEAKLHAQNKIIEKIQELMAWERDRLFQQQEIADEKRGIDETATSEQESATEAELASYQQLTDAKALLDIKGYDKRQKILNLEKKNKIRDIKEDIKNKILLKKAIDKIEQIYTLKSDVLAKQLATEKRTALLSIAETSLGTLRTILEAEGSSAKKKKAFIIALMTAELALGITRMWSAEATKGVLGIAPAVVGTAALVANYGAQMHRLTKGTSGIDTPIPSINEPVTPVEIVNPASTIPDEGISDTGGGSGYTGSGYTGVETAGGGGITKITNINVGGVDVNLGGIDVKEENLETILRDIGESVKSRTVEAVTMAMQIYNTGKDLESESV